MKKIIEFDTKARIKLKKGVDILAKTVAVTLGPKGRNVIISNPFGFPVSTKDGVSVAKQVFVEDEVENVGVLMIKEVSSKTSDKAGDGTTTATILAQRILEIGIEHIENGANPIDLKRGIDLAVAVVSKQLRKMSKSLKNKEEITHVGSISANNDIEIGNLISDAVDRVGKDGIITVEESKTVETSLDFVEGFQFDKGYISPYFATNESMEAILINPVILIYDDSINNHKELVSLLDKISQLGRPVLIIADDVTGGALQLIVVNKLKGALMVVAVKSPGFGTEKDEILKDLATLTGGTVISEDSGFTLEKASVSFLGAAQKVVVTKDSTTIIESAGDSKEIKSRIKQVKSEIETSSNEAEKENLRKRLAKLTGGVAVLNIGAATEIELKEKRDRVEDALHATRAAVEEGIVPGGGVAYLRTLPALDKLKAEGDQRIGVDIISMAIESPAYQIAKNAGHNGNEIVERIKKGKNDFGFNARTEQFEPLLESGVIDPTKVTRIALENAASVAGIMLTTEAVIVDAKEEMNKKTQNLV